MRTTAGGGKLNKFNRRQKALKYWESKLLDRETFYGMNGSPLKKEEKEEKENFIKSQIDAIKKKGQ